MEERKKDMKILVVGGVAAGTKVAAKLKRENRDAMITVFNKGKDISYAGCGLPYYVGHVIEDKAELIVNTPQKYEKLTGVQVCCESEVTSVNRDDKSICVKDLKTGKESVHTYDKLVIATGASPVQPPVPGADLENVFFMRTPDDAIALREVIDGNDIKRAVVVGGGYIGLEVAENLHAKGIRTVVIDMAEHVLPGFDAELCEKVENHLADEGVMVFTSTKLEALEGDGKVEKVITDSRKFKADLVVMSVGIRPNTAFLAESGLEMFKGTILTDANCRTNDPDIYAVGDCAMVHNAITGKPVWSPMGSTANIAGRLTARNINGEDVSYRGVLGTAVCHLPNMNAGRTGLTEAQAISEGFDPISVISVTDDKAHYYPGSAPFITKMIADKTSKRLLGLQVLGKGAVDKMVDIAVTAIMLKATLDDLVDFDFAYAPPFSTAIHPFATTLNILMNKVSGAFETVTPKELKEGAAKGYTLIDGCLSPSIEDARYVELTDVDGPIDGLALDEKILLVCNKGKRAYLLQNRLKGYGYTGTKVLEGGIFVTEPDTIKENI